MRLAVKFSATSFSLVCFSSWYLPHEQTYQKHRRTTTVDNTYFGGIVDFNFLVFFNRFVPLWHAICYAGAGAQGNKV